MFDNYVFKRISPCGKLMNTSILPYEDCEESMKLFIDSFENLFSYLNIIKNKGYNKVIDINLSLLEDKVKKFIFNYNNMKNTEAAVCYIDNIDRDKLIKDNAGTKFVGLIDILYRDEGPYVFYNSYELKNILISFNYIIFDFDILYENSKILEIIDEEYDSYYEFRNDILSKFIDIFGKLITIKIEENHFRILISEFHDKMINT